MKKLLLALIFVLPSLTHAQADSFSSTGVNATATVEVVASVQTALQLNKLQDLWFGNFVGVEGAASEAEVLANASAATAGRQAGLIEVTGAAGQAIVFSVSGGSTTFTTTPIPGAPTTNYTVELRNGTGATYQKVEVELSFATSADDYATEYTPGNSVTLPADGLIFAVGGKLDFENTTDETDQAVSVGSVSGTFKGEVTISASYF